MSEGEWKPTPKKHEPKLETRNKLLNLQSILGGEHYPNMAKERVTETQAAMKAATR
ncbi:hypothetical protein F2Q70_00029113 [Brassica cretica]|uniref:Uncharacterized protein n=2 Tax=Brassica cretica TaxID=69181 RepID=A0A3N6QES2_BRACR|nr:hypothetical protein F2Q70_00029113 [Brassica cretica]KAF2556124.1 hypothetical protein F2Q68_00016426 [Brassica cretica]KAF3589823.1 hypothetical protein F2Q69_00030241 [Brassica cretica]KAF3609478.1 hypothetical protein DY000_02048833 [Brassica cretica]